jgi:hypothetical protein
LWNAFFSLFGLVWAMPWGVANLLRSWWSGGRTRSVVVWKMIPLCIMWCLWFERNERFFEDSERSLEDLLHFFLTTLFTWTEAWLASLVISFSDFLSLFSSPLGIFLYTSCVLGLHPSGCFSIKHYLSKKKTRNKGVTEDYLFLSGFAKLFLMHGTFHFFLLQIQGYCLLLPTFDMHKCLAYSLLLVTMDHEACGLK